MPTIHADSLPQCPRPTSFANRGSLLPEKGEQNDIAVESDDSQTDFELFHENSEEINEASLILNNPAEIQDFIKDKSKF